MMWRQELQAKFA